VATKPQVDAARNTPALIDDKAAYGDRPLDPWFVTGLAEGEGCFCVSFSQRPKLRLGLEVRPSFSLSLNEKDRALLQDLQAFLGCGSLRESRGDRTVKYESRSVRELLECVIPHSRCSRFAGARREALTVSRRSAG
jgi:LAGLIDADG DNA endonuclease family protein